MVLSKISELGGSVIMGNVNDEDIVTMIADGTSKAGWLVGNSSGAATGTQANSLDNFVGIQVERYDTDIDTAPTATKAVSVVIPKSGHQYRVKILDMNATGAGTPAIFTTTAGALGPQGDVEAVTVAYTMGSYTDGDTVAEVRWG